MFNFKDIYINNWFSVVGPLEKNSKLKNYDIAMSDYYFNEPTAEKAEIKMQNVVLNYLTKSKTPNIVVGGDLSNQIVTTNMAIKDRNIPYLGLYSACATSGESLITLASLIDSKKISEGICITSSHNLNAEKEFRFPIEYGAPKPMRSTFTVTGAIGLYLSKTKSNIKIVNGTVGCVIDSYVKDVYNMGGVMAPSAADTLIRHLNLTKTKIEDYDLVVTGDLGLVGEKIFREILKQKNIKLKNYVDAGTIIYNNIKYSGGSGPVTLPLVFFNNIVHNKKYKKIIYIATGSLHSPVLVNQKNTIPAISHALTIEVER